MAFIYLNNSVWLNISYQSLFLCPHPHLLKAAVGHVAFHYDVMMLPPQKKYIPSLNYENSCAPVKAQLLHARYEIITLISVLNIVNPSPAEARYGLLVISYYVTNPQRG